VRELQQCEQKFVSVGSMERVELLQGFIQGSLLTNHSLSGEPAIHRRSIEQ
jgi:hypothetical protein